MENRYITVQYKLYAPMGAEKQIELIEETRPDMPFQFISGMGMVLEALENHLHPLQAGEAFKIGENDIEKDGIRLVAAHIDSPRIDLKQVPMYEDSALLLKSLPGYRRLIFSLALPTPITVPVWRRPARQAFRRPWILWKTLPLRQQKLPAHIPSSRVLKTAITQ